MRRARTLVVALAGGSFEPEDPAPAGFPDGRPARTRRGIPTWLLSVAMLLVLAVAIVAVLVLSLGPRDGEVAGTRPAAPGSGAGTGGAEITGTVTLAPELAGRLRATSVLFVMLRKGSGPPFAVKRISGPTFPLAYRIGPEDVMMAGTPFEGEVTVSARVSAAGGAGPAQPGDLGGEHPGSVTVGARAVDIRIARVH